MYTSRLFFFILFISISFPNSNNPCFPEQSYNSRTEYSIGDTLTIDDQNVLYPVCNGSGNYSVNDSFSFADLNGDLNGGDYKITLISMNATW